MAAAPFRPQLTNKAILRIEQITDHPSRPLLVIDGDSFAHRAYHGLPKSIRRRGNRGGGAIVGFANFLLRLYESERPRAVLVGWDTLDVPTYRHRAFAAYQSGRQFDPELRDQLDVLPHFVAACGFVCAKSPGYEADDFLAAAVANEELRGGMAIVATGDRDAFQLASELTTILQPVRAGQMSRIGPKEVRERYGVEPKQVPDFIALRGDPSDKLPGATGVGPKGAASLLHRYGTLEDARANQENGAAQTSSDNVTIVASTDPLSPMYFEISLAVAAKALPGSQRRVYTGQRPNREFFLNSRTSTTRTGHRASLRKR
jgi:DNA polymerase-1